MVLEPKYLAKEVIIHPNHHLTTWEETIKHPLNTMRKSRGFPCSTTRYPQFPTLRLESDPVAARVREVSLTPGWVQLMKLERDYLHDPTKRCGKLDYTLQGINISHPKALLKMIFLFQRWDMFVSWRVTPISDVIALLRSGFWAHPVDHDPNFSEHFFTNANSVGVSYRGRPSVVEPKNHTKESSFLGELDGDSIKHQSKKIEACQG